MNIFKDKGLGNEIYQQLNEKCQSPKESVITKISETREKLENYNKPI